MECFYGCGKEAKFFFKNGNGCCEQSPNSCESKRKKDSEKKKGSFKGTPAWKIEGYVSVGWSKGLTKEDNPNLARPKQKGIRFGASLNGHTQETKDKLSKVAISRKLGGYVEGSGRGKKCWYESEIAGKVFLDSSYELRYAKYLDANKISWIKNTKKFPYYDENNMLRNYIPDFYLLDSDEYVEIKGYKTVRDEYKWNQFPHTLKVFFNTDLLKLEE